eukprot:767454-Hanusia_phi.AAC.5
MQSQDDLKIRTENPTHIAQWKQALTKASIWKASHAVLEKKNVTPLDKDNEKMVSRHRQTSTDVLETALERSAASRDEGIADAKGNVDGEWILNIELLEESCVACFTAS